MADTICVDPSKEQTFAGIERRWHITRSLAVFLRQDELDCGMRQSVAAEFVSRYEFAVLPSAEHMPPIGGREVFKIEKSRGVVHSFRKSPMVLKRDANLSPRELSAYEFAGNSI